MTYTEIYNTFKKQFWLLVRIAFPLSRDNLQNVREKVLVLKSKAVKHIFQWIFGENEINKYVNTENKNFGEKGIYSMSDLEFLN